MREIIFRGERKNNGKWIYGSLVNDGKDCYIYDPTLNKPFLACMIPVIPETVGQFLSKEDKNGKRIFKDDKIKTFDGEIGIVDYDAGFCCWGIVNERRFRGFENIMIAYNDWYYW